MMRPHCFSWLPVAARSPRAPPPDKLRCISGRPIHTYSHNPVIQRLGFIASNDERPGFDSRWAHLFALRLVFTSCPTKSWPAAAYPSVKSIPIFLYWAVVAQTYVLTGHEVICQRTALITTAVEIAWSIQYV